MARNSTLHIDIPQSTLQPHLYTKSMNPTSSPESPSYFQPKDESSSFSFTRNGSQYLASPSSVTSCSPMMTPLPFKMLHEPLQMPPTPHPSGRVEKNKLGEYEFPHSAGLIKGETTPFQSHLNHPFTQFRQQRLQEQQQHLATSKSPQTYVSKYASYTNSSQSFIRSQHLSGLKPSTNMALSMIEKEKPAFHYTPNSNRDSLVSPPPPPYLPSDHGAVVFPLDSSLPAFAAGHLAITPASLAKSKRSSLPPNSPSTFSPLASPTNPALARTARELKRHSLPVTASSAAVQWPSAMTMAVAAVSRPKMARTMPSQGASFLYGNDGGHGSDVRSPLATSTPTVFTPRTTRLLEKSETDTLYSYKISEDGSSSPRSATGGLTGGASPSARHFDRVGDASHSRRGMTSPLGTGQEQFPGFWQDAKGHRIHWMLYSLGAMAVGCGVVIVLMPALLALAAVVPGVFLVGMGAQYTGYRWRRRKHYRHQLQELKSPHAAKADTIKGHQSHAHRSSNSSVHTSAGSIGSDSFLEPHHPSPPHILQAQFQHQYFRNTSSVTGSPPRFPEGYQFREHPAVAAAAAASYPRAQSPSPEYRQSWHNMYGQQRQQRPTLHNLDTRSRTIQRQASSSSIASSGTVSSTSTSSELDSSVSPAHLMHNRGYALTATQPKSPVDSGIGSSSSLLLAATSTTTATVLPPPPAYVSRKCDDEGESEGTVLREKAAGSLGIALPEIASVGDLMQEFAVDLGSFQF